MSQYLLSIYQPDGEPPPPEVLQRIMRDVTAVIEDAKEAGAWVFNGGLQPPRTAAVVRLQAGQVLVTDGPFVESKEHLGGFLVVEAADLDEALAWGRKLAGALTVDGTGTSHPGLPVEVRPFAERHTRR